MNTEQVLGKWDLFKAKVRQKWDKITEDDVTNLRSNPSTLGHYLEERYGLSRDEANRSASSFMHDFTADDVELSGNRIYPQNDGETEPVVVASPTQQRGSSSNPDVNTKIPPSPSQQHPGTRF